MAVSSEDLGVQCCRQSWPTHHQESDSWEIILTTLMWGIASLYCKYKRSRVYKGTFSNTCDFPAGCFGAGGGPPPRSPDLRLPRFLYVGWKSRADLSYKGKKKKNRICEVHCPVASLDFPNKVKKVAGLMHGCVSLRIQAESGSFEHLLEIRQWNVFV